MVDNTGFKMVNFIVTMIYQWAYVQSTGIRMEGLFEVTKLLKVKTKDKTRYYNSDGKCHRDNGPAIILSYGTQAWYQNGKCHRDNDLPAIIYTSGDREWYRDGKRHRDNDLPAIIRSNGSQLWYQNGRYIRSEKAT